MNLEYTVCLSLSLQYLLNDILHIHRASISYEKGESSNSQRSQGNNFNDRYGDESFNGGSGYVSNGGKNFHQRPSYNNFNTIRNNRGGNNFRSNSGNRLGSIFSYDNGKGSQFSGS